MADGPFAGPFPIVRDGDSLLLTAAVLRVAATPHDGEVDETVILQKRLEQAFRAAEVEQSVPTPQAIDLVIIMCLCLARAFRLRQPFVAWAGLTTISSSQSSTFERNFPLAQTGILALVVGFRALGLPMRLKSRPFGFILMGPFFLTRPRLAMRLQLLWSPSRATGSSLGSALGTVQPTQLVPIKLNSALPLSQPNLHLIYLKCQQFAFGSCPDVVFIFDSLTVGRQLEGTWAAHCSPRHGRLNRALVRLIETRFGAHCHYRFTPGHADDPGNELVDVVAREAAAGQPCHDWGPFFSHVLTEPFLTGITWAWTILIHLGDHPWLLMSCVCQRPLLPHLRSWISWFHRLLMICGNNTLLRSLPLVVMF